MIALYAARYWKYAAIGVLAILLALAWHSRNSWKETAGVWRAAFDTQKSAYEAAQSAARAKAEAQVVKDRSRYETLAERADNAEKEIAGLRSAADRYARTHRVRSQAGSATRSAGGTSGASAGNTAQGGDGAGADTDVVVSRPDFDQLVENTIRLKQVHDWGESLVAEGLAVKAE